MRVEDAEQVLRAGANVKVNMMSVEYLVRLAAAARDSGTDLTIVGEMPVNRMLTVAAAGGGNVTFDTTKHDIKE